MTGALMLDLKLFQLMGMSSAILWNAAISSVLQLCMDLAQSKLACSSMRQYEWRPPILFGKAESQHVCMIILCQSSHLTQPPDGVHNLRRYKLSK